MKLDLTSFEMALTQLEQSLARSEDKQWMAQQDDITHNIVRAGVIQHFEVVFELCWKYIQRWLAENRSPNEAEFPRTRKDLFRLAAKNGLVNDPENWFDYGDACNITSHTYNRKTADQVYLEAKSLAKSARYLLQRLKMLSQNLTYL